MHCGKFSKYEDMDSYTPFGCSNPASPEPYDPTVICGDCSEKLYHYYIGRFELGDFKGDWQKSDAELRAAREFGLEWVGSFSRDINGRRYHNEWIRVNNYT
jgi:hypothetical protein